MSKKPRRELQALSIHGKWIRWIEYRYGYSRTAIAAEVGRSPGMISNYCYGPGNDRAKEPTPMVRRRLAKLAKISEAQYFFGPPESVPQLTTVAS